MGAEDKVGAVQLNARLCGVSPPVTRRLVITAQASLAQPHRAYSLLSIHGPTLTLTQTQLKLPP
jgi:hypothetical protein